MMDDSAFEVLNYLDIYHEVSNIDAIDLDREDGELLELLDALEDEGLVNGSWKITPAGETAVEAERQRRIRALTRPNTFRDRCDEFEELGSKLKTTITEYQQVRASTEDEEPAVPVERLERIHDDATAIIEGLSDSFPQLERYVESLERAIENVRAGRSEYLVHHDRSYHNVWHELHELLLALSGRERDG